MKRFIHLAMMASLTIATVLSCEKKEDDFITSPSTTIMTRTMTENDYLKYNVTQQMAVDFISSNQDNPPIISVEPYEIDGITCFFIINFDKGFKIVAADKRVQPVLAESNTDLLYPHKTINKGVSIWLEDTADRIRILKENNPNTGEDYSDLWAPFSESNLKKKITNGNNNRRYDNDSIWVLIYTTSSSYTSFSVNSGPIVSTKWGQGSPWNNKMPTILGDHCPSGCLPVAVAQVLYYFNSSISTPDDLWHNVSIQSTSTCSTHGGLLVSLNKSNHTTNSNRWYDMPLNKYGNNTDYVSNLMLDLGERLNIHYYTYGSGGFYNLGGTIPNLSLCGITCYTSPYSFNNVKFDIIDNKPLMIGAGTNTYDLGGHIWVIDGCREYTLKYTTIGTYYCIHPNNLNNYPINSGVLTYDEMMALYPDANGGSYQVSETYYFDNQKSIHMNWGYDGTCDGWYNMLDTNDWIYTNSNGASSNYLYNRILYSNISTTQLN